MIAIFFVYMATTKNKENGSTTEKGNNILCSCYIIQSSLQNNTCVKCICSNYM